MNVIQSASSLKWAFEAPWTYHDEPLSATMMPYCCMATAITRA